MHFREATEKDFEDIANLIKSEEELFLVYPSGKFPLNVAQVKELYEARKDFTVATYHDKVVGFANLYDYLEGQYIFIGNVVIEEKYRGKGYGKALVDHMIALASAYKLPEIRISVFSDNTSALLLYTEFGFELYESKEQNNHLGNSVTLLHMRLLLNVH